ncbi:MAG: hypothetical protein A3K10_03780 [Bacteroidetes bacterium RIFCSPLOWO2_12_FULL_31_6]|nr:MAG: hypothetical protein A3K10_03780 [Bacteroidetes bacterium RIFCSPLOWO2_12_FULL_31_6]
MGIIKSRNLRDIPIVVTIIGLTKASFSLNDRLLIKKLIYFLSELQDIDIEKRQKLISSIEESDKHKIRIGEKLLQTTPAS